MTFEEFRAEILDALKNSPAAWLLDPPTHYTTMMLLHGAINSAWGLTSKGKPVAPNKRNHGKNVTEVVAELVKPGGLLETHGNRRLGKIPK